MRNPVNEFETGEPPYDRELQPFFDKFEDIFCRSPDDESLEVRRAGRHDTNRELGLDTLTAAIAESEHLMSLAPPPGFTVVDAVGKAKSGNKTPPKDATLRIILKSKDHLAMLCEDVTCMWWM